MCNLQTHIERDIRAREEAKQQEAPVKMRYAVTVRVLPENVDAYLSDGWEIV